MLVYLGLPSIGRDIKMQFAVTKDAHPVAVASGVLFLEFVKLVRQHIDSALQFVSVRRHSLAREDYKT